MRELENLVERAVALSQGERIEPEALPPTVLEPVGPSSPSALPGEGETLDTLVNDFERALLREALTKSGGVKKKAAQLLGISFRSFRYRLEKLGLDGSPGEER